MPTSTPVDGRDELLRSVRAGFIRQGLTLASWCRIAGVRHSYAYKVLRHETNGPAAIALRCRLTSDSQKLAV